MAVERHPGHAVVGFGEIGHRHVRQRSIREHDIRRQGSRITAHRRQYFPQRTPPSRGQWLMHEHAIERAAFGQQPQPAPIEPRAPHHITHIAEWAFGERGFELATGGGAKSAHTAHTQSHGGRRCLRGARFECRIPRRACQVHRPHLDTVSSTILDQGARCVEPHRLCIQHCRQEFGMVVVSQPRRRIHEQRKTGGVTFGKPVVGKGVDLCKDTVRDITVDAVGVHAGEHLLAQRFHLFVAALVSHRPTQCVSLTGREAGAGNGNLHALFLKQRHTERALEDRFERGMRIDHLLDTRAPPQIRMYHRTLNRTGADDRDFDDDIVERARLETRQRVHLRTTLDLEHPDGIGGAHIVVHGLVAGVEQREIDRHAARLPHVHETILQYGEHAQAEQVDLDQARGIEIVAFPLNHGAARHRCRFNRHHGGQRLAREHKAADMNRAMAWELMQTIDDVGQRADALILRIEAGALENVSEGCCRRCRRCRGC